MRFADTNYCLVVRIYVKCFASVEPNLERAMNAASNELAVRVNDARVFAVTDARVDLQPR